MLRTQPVGMMSKLSESEGFEVIERAYTQLSDKDRENIDKLCFQLARHGLPNIGRKSFLQLLAALGIFMNKEGVTLYGKPL